MQIFSGYFFPFAARVDVRKEIEDKKKRRLSTTSSTKPLLLLCLLILALSLLHSSDAQCRSTKFRSSLLVRCDLEEDLLRKELDLERIVDAAIVEKGAEELPFTLMIKWMVCDADRPFRLSPLSANLTSRLKILELKDFSPDYGRPCAPNFTRPWILEAPNLINLKIHSKDMRILENVVMGKKMNITSLSIVGYDNSKGVPGGRLPDSWTRTRFLKPTLATLRHLGLSVIDPDGALSHLPEGSRLELTKNNFTQIPLAFKSTLKELSLEANPLTSLQGPVNAVKLQAWKSMVDFVNVTSDELKILSCWKCRLRFLNESNFLVGDQTEEVDLSANEIQFVQKGFFARMSLKEIILDSNKLASIPRGIFSDLKFVTTISLMMNRIFTMEPRVFENLPRLIHLNLVGNRIETLNGDTFHNLPNLKFLILAQNKISRIDNLVRLLPSLSALRLNDNRLKQFNLWPEFEAKNESDGIFDDFLSRNVGYRSVFIGVQRNNISSLVLPSDFESLRRMKGGLVKLIKSKEQMFKCENITANNKYTIDLGDNDLVSYNLRHLFCLVKLYHCSGIGVFFPDFHHQKKWQVCHGCDMQDSALLLKSLALSTENSADDHVISCQTNHDSFPFRNSTCKVIADTDFSLTSPKSSLTSATPEMYSCFVSKCDDRCKCLRISEDKVRADCSSKYLMSLPRDFDEAFRYDFNVSFNRVKKLKMEEVQILLQRTETLYLRSNMLSDLSEIVHILVRSRSKVLKLVDLSFNQFREFPANLFHLFPTPTKIRLKGNPFFCGCDELNPWKFANDPRFPDLVEDYVDISCSVNYDEEVKVISVFNITEEYYKSVCSDPDTSLVKIVVAVFVAVVIVVIIAAIALSWYRETVKIGVWHHCHSLYFFIKRIFQKVRPRTRFPRYDVYLSFADEDRDAHPAIFASILEEIDRLGLKCFVRGDLYRGGGQLGGSDAEDQAAAIEDSACFVPVLTPSYLRNEWRLYEFRQAHHLAIENESFGLKLLFLDADFLAAMKNGRNADGADADADVIVHVRTKNFLRFYIKNFKKRWRFFLDNNRADNNNDGDDRAVNDATDVVTFRRGLGNGTIFLPDPDRGGPSDDGGDDEDPESGVASSTDVHRVANGSVDRQLQVISNYNEEDIIDRLPNPPTNDLTSEENERALPQDAADPATAAAASTAASSFSSPSLTAVQVHSLPVDT